MKYSYLVPDTDESLGRGMSQAVSPLPVTTEAHIISQVRPRGICDEQSDSATY